MSDIPLVKVVIAGDGNVGKTSLIRRYTEAKFSQSRVATIGVDFAAHTVQLADGAVRLSIWDMAGQERFQVVRSGFYRGSLATALVYDVSDPASLEHLSRWREEILGVLPQQQFVVVGNKLDLPRIAQANTAKEYAAGIQARHIETSALTGEGVAELFESLARLATGRPEP